VETKEEIIRTIFTSKSNSKNYFNPADYGSALVFPKHFCNLRPDRFWKRPKTSSSGGSSLPEPVVEVSAEVTAAPTSSEVPVPAAGPVAGGSSSSSSLTTAVFTTKASVKEMPPGPNQSYVAAAVSGSQVQQMLRVLKDASRSSSGRRRKEAARRANNEEGQMKEAIETTYEVCNYSWFILSSNIKIWGRNPNRILRDKERYS
jgi:hypothetical protein